MQLKQLAALLAFLDNEVAKHVDAVADRLERVRHEPDPTGLDRAYPDMQNRPVHTPENPDEH